MVNIILVILKYNQKLPILTETGELLGIIDAEAFSLDFFDQNTLALLVAACLVITECLPAS